MGERDRQRQTDRAVRTQPEYLQTRHRRKSVVFKAYPLLQRISITDFGGRAEHL